MILWKTYFVSFDVKAYLNIANILRSLKTDYLFSKFICQKYFNLKILFSSVETWKIKQVSHFHNLCVYQKNTFVKNVFICVVLHWMLYNLVRVGRVRLQTSINSLSPSLMNRPLP